MSIWKKIQLKLAILPKQPRKLPLTTLATPTIYTSSSINEDKMMRRKEEWVLTISVL